VAIVEYGGGVVAFRGSIAGTTFQRNRAGEIARSRGRTTVQPTPKQSVAQNIHTSLIGEFLATTPAEKLLWDLFAATNTKENAFGQTKILTGQNWFESINFYLALLGEPTVTTPPVHMLPIPSFSITANIGSAPGTTGTLDVDLVPPFNNPNNGILIYTTQPLTRVTTSLRQFWRLTFFDSGMQGGNVDITTEWETTHGIGIPNNTARFNFSIGVMVRAVRLSSGIAGVGVIDVPAVQNP